MGIGASLKKGFSVATKSMDLVSILFAFGFLWNLISIFAIKNPETPSPQESAIMIVSGVLFILISIFMQAGSMGYVRDVVKTGTAGLASFTANGGKYYGRFFLVGIIVALVAGVFLILASLALAFLGQNPPPQNIIGFVLAALADGIGVCFVMLMFLAPYIVVSEDKKAIESLKQSGALVKQDFLRILGIFVLLILIGFGLGLIIGLIFAAISAAGAGESTVAKVIFAALSSFVNAFLGVLVTGTFMTYYLGRNQSNTAGA